MHGRATLPLVVFVGCLTSTPDGPPDAGEGAGTASSTGGEPSSRASSLPSPWMSSSASMLPPLEGAASSGVVSASASSPSSSGTVAPSSGVVPDAGPLVFVPACPPAGALDCSPGSGTGEGDECRDGPSCFVTSVQAAVRNAISVHPEWFDPSGGCPFILDVDAFLDNVVAHLASQGLCAMRDPNAPGEEVTVKHDNSYTENFDIVASTGCARSGSAIYTGYCHPAWW